MTKNRQQLLAIFALVAIVFLVGDRLILSPLVASWKDRSERITALERSIAQGSLLIERRDIIEERWESMSTNTLPQNMSAAENRVLKAFDRWSQQSGISIVSLKPQWRQSEDDYLTLQCRAEGFGSMQALTRFLYELENDPIALKVESVEMSARDKEGRQLGLGVQVSGLVMTREDQ